MIQMGDLASVDQSQDDNSRFKGANNAQTEHNLRRKLSRRHSKMKTPYEDSGERYLEKSMSEESLERLN